MLGKKSSVYFDFYPEIFAQRLVDAIPDLPFIESIVWLPRLTIYCPAASFGRRATCGFAGLGQCGLQEALPPQAVAGRFLQWQGARQRN